MPTLSFKWKAIIFGYIWQAVAIVATVIAHQISAEYRSVLISVSSYTYVYMHHSYRADTHTHTRAECRIRCWVYGRSDAMRCSIEQNRNDIHSEASQRESLKCEYKFDNNRKHRLGLAMERSEWKKKVARNRREDVSSAQISYNNVYKSFDILSSVSSFLILEKRLQSELVW